MQKMTGLDLEFAVAEMQPLAGKRIAKIRKTGGGIYLFKIGTGEMLFEPGVRFHLTRQVLFAADSPDGFVSFLRKNLEGKTAAKISKVDGERIVEVQTKSKERLVFECFRKGNIILVGEDGRIISCFMMEESGGRRIAKGEGYSYPAPTAFAAKRPEKIGFVVKLNAEGEPVSYSCDGNAEGKTFASFSEAADFYYANAKAESPLEAAAAKKIEGLQARLAGQRAQAEEFDRQSAQARSCAEAIYRNFGLAEKAIQEAKKGKAEVEAEL